MTSPLDRVLLSVPMTISMLRPMMSIPGGWRMFRPIISIPGGWHMFGPLYSFRGGGTRLRLDVGAWFGKAGWKMSSDNGGYPAPMLVVVGFGSAGGVGCVGG